MPVEFKIQLNDVADVRSDLLVLKHAQEFYGADSAIATELSDRGVCAMADLRADAGRLIVVPSRGVIAPARVMFVGVPSLRRFRYKEMRQLARSAIEWVAGSPEPIRTLTTTVHGVGYGLDIEESLQAMVFGFQIGLSEHQTSLEKITFVERDPRRASILEASLRTMGPLKTMQERPSSPMTEPVKPKPAAADKQTAFVAMPFSREFEDVYEFGIYGPVRRCGFVVERVDESTFAGDIVGRIQEGIRASRFVIADLTAERPNVYLEVGFAWGLNKPVILIAREGQKLHFDLSHHKCLFYPTIGRLAGDIDRIVRELFCTDIANSNGAKGGA